MESGLQEVLATSARMHQKICAIIICATKPCQPVACSQKAFCLCCSCHNYLPPAYFEMLMILAPA